jgi:hypothetical protein
LYVHSDLGAPTYSPIKNCSSHSLSDNDNNEDKRVNAKQKSERNMSSVFEVATLKSPSSSGKKTEHFWIYIDNSGE